jgi:hypothetical protein
LISAEERRAETVDISHSGATVIDLPPVVVPLLTLVRQPLPLGGAERNPVAMG